MSKKHHWQIFQILELETLFENVIAVKFFLTKTKLISQVNKDIIHHI